MVCLKCGEKTRYKRISDFVKMHLIKVHQINSKKYYDNYLRKSGEGICEVCKNETKFISLSCGYNKTCSNKCFKNNKTAIIKRKKTNLKKYGVECNLQNEECFKKCTETLKQRYGVSNIHESEEISNKRKKTNLKKYGVEKPFQSNQIQDKVKKTVLEKYGVCSTLKLDDVKKKIKETVLEKYGNEFYYNTDDFRQKTKVNNMKKYGVNSTLSIPKIHEKSMNSLHEHKIDDLKELIKNDYDFISSTSKCFKLKCLKCGKVFEINKVTFYKRKQNQIIICTNCNNLNGYSNIEKELLNFIKDNYKSKVISNVKNIINPYELDIYLPELKLAFEFNGLYWHSELYKDKNYHLDKTLRCEKQDIHLVHIYEDDWIYKQDIVKSRILNLLKQSNRIFARKCVIVKNVDYKQSQQFLNNSHIQGNCVSKIRLGLYCKGELVSLMTFGSLRKNLGQKSKKGSFELLRFCNKLNTTVIGGANKLFKYFIKNFEHEIIISYADRSWTMNNGNTLYDKLGFENVNISSPNYFYILQNNRENRFKYRKDVLIKEGFDKNKTEHQIMLERKIYRIYNSGQLKFQYKKD